MCDIHKNINHIFCVYKYTIMEWRCHCNRMVVLCASSFQDIFPSEVKTIPFWKWLQKNEFMENFTKVASAYCKYQNIIQRGKRELVVHVVDSSLSKTWIFWSYKPSTRWPLKAEVSNWGGGIECRKSPHLKVEAKT